MGGAKATEPDPKRAVRGRPGPVRSAVDQTIRDLAGKRTLPLAMRELSARQTIDALLAQSYADAVDRAAAADDGTRLIAAGEKLRGVLASLEPAAPKQPEGGTPGERSSGSRARVIDMFSGVPTLGDAADA